MPLGEHSVSLSVSVSELIESSIFMCREVFFGWYVALPLAPAVPGILMDISHCCFRDRLLVLFVVFIGPQSLE
jgi:hypothetical protein